MHDSQSHGDSRESTKHPTPGHLLNPYFSWTLSQQHATLPQDPAFFCPAQVCPLCPILDCPSHIFPGPSDKDSVRHPAPCRLCTHQFGEKGGSWELRAADGSSCVERDHHLKAFSPYPKRGI